jgi:hypothetical protein
MSPPRRKRPARRLDEPRDQVEAWSCRNPTGRAASELAAMDVERNRARACRSARSFPRGDRNDGRRSARGARAAASGQDPPS